jgi:hypothetical protein
MGRDLDNKRFITHHTGQISPQLLHLQLLEVVVVQREKLLGRS